MSGSHCTCKSLLSGAFSSAWQRPTTTALPAFLLPTISIKQTASFSSSASLQKRNKKTKKGSKLPVDNNPWRGISALYRSGIPREIKFTVDVNDLPKPVLDPKERSEVQVNPKHGLWGFFNASRSALWTPSQLADHGRGWTREEIRRKSWHDLHALWWMCLKERNRIATHKHERERLGPMYGEREETDREIEIRQTMRAIKHVLLERYYAWQEARRLAMQDEEVDLYADTEAGEKVYNPAYKPEEERFYEPARPHTVLDAPPVASVART